MPSWVWPAVKLILPHVAGIVAAAKPAFTKRPHGEPGDQGSVIQQQIGELQSAASNNASHIKELAEQLRLTITALEKGASETEARLKRAYAIATAALALSGAALAVAILVLVR